MYQSFIGLEIHIQLLTNTKVFCSCAANFGDEPNTNVCPVCMGYPGVLPALNEEAMEKAYLVARALNCDLSPECYFDRKNYFYPDLPKNYQITQFNQPLGTNGYIDLEFRKNRKRIRVKEIHLEEDAGKMIHAGDMSLLDFNRAGTPLLEIVTEPDLEIGEEAEVLLQELRRLVRYIEVCDGNMEEGSMRCDANVSINLQGHGLGSKVEIKNMNSSRFVRKALDYEIDRQQEVLERGGTIRQETRLWNENRDITEAMRSKESAHDYRYFPEPDMPHFKADDAFIARVESLLVELPPSRRERFQSEYGLSAGQAEFLCDERSTADFYEETVKLGADPQQVALWLAGDVRKELNHLDMELIASPVTPERLAELLALLEKGTIHGKIAKQTLVRIFEENKDPRGIIEEQGWEQITDPSALKKLVAEVLASNGAAVEQIRGGDARPMGFLVGQVMKASRGRAEPKLVQDILEAELSYSVIQVLSFGGAIAGKRRADGRIEPGDLVDVTELFRKDPALPENLRFSEVRLGQFLSEEITPADWAALIDTVRATLEDGNVSGLVIAHGTDTLAYTASLLYWFFSDTKVPLVLTAGAVPADSGGRTDAVDNLRTAIRTAGSGEAGIHVVYGKDDFYPVNLRFERSGYTAVPKSGKEIPVIGAGADFYTGLFRNWNYEGLTRSAPALAGSAVPESREELTGALEAAIAQIFIAKVYPGMSGDYLLALMDAGVRYFILEIFDTGTANVRETPFSLRKALMEGRRRGVRFFCTSQQEGIVDFADYITGHELWQEGAIPMGSLTTESAFTRLVATLLIGENEDDIVRLMEDT